MGQQEFHHVKKIRNVWIPERLSSKRRFTRNSGSTPVHHMRSMSRSSFAPWDIFSSLSPTLFFLDWISLNFLQEL